MIKMHNFRRMKIVIFLTAIVFLALLSGCITIDSISQPTSAVAADTITTTMTVSLQMNTSGSSYKPAFAVKIPNDWTVYSVYYSGTGGASGMNEYMTADSAASSDIESRYSSGSSYQWKAYSGTSRIVNTIPAGASVTVRLTTGSTTGSYINNYTVGFYTGSAWMWTDSELKSITLTANSPPNTPTLSGPTSGTAGTSYTFTGSATDPDGHSIYYVFEWGDSTTSTTSYYSSGVSGSKDKSWSAAGTYNVRVKAVDNRGAYTWSGFQTVNIASAGGTTPPPTTGSISVVSSPSSAEVYLDGTLKGNAPQMLTSVSSGSHVIWCKKTGYEDFMQSVSVTAPDIATVTCSMVLSSGVTPTAGTPAPTVPTPDATIGSTVPPGIGSISVVSNPDGAEVYLDGVKKGNAFKTLADVSSGQHMIWCKKEGYEVFQQVVTVTGGEAAAVTCNLELSSGETPSETESAEVTGDVTPMQTPKAGAPGFTVTLALIISIGYILRKKQ